MKSIITIVLCCAAILVEGTITTLPVVLLFLILYSIFFRDQAAFLYGFFAAIVLDILHLRPIGTTALFFLPIILLLFLYQRKFEITSLPFVGVALFFSSLLYAFLFIGTAVFLQAFLITISGVIFFFLLSHIVVKGKQSGHSHYLL